MIFALFVKASNWFMKFQFSGSDFVRNCILCESCNNGWLRVLALGSAVALATNISALNRLISHLNDWNSAWGMIVEFSFCRITLTIERSVSFSPVRAHWILNGIARFYPIDFHSQRNSFVAEHHIHSVPSIILYRMVRERKTIYQIHFKNSSFWYLVHRSIGKI